MKNDHKHLPLFQTLEPCISQDSHHPAKQNAVMNELDKRDDLGGEH